MTPFEFTWTLIGGFLLGTGFGIVMALRFRGKK